MYKVVGKNEALHWFCKKCNSNAMKMLKDVGERATEVDSQIAKLEKDMKVMSGHITKVKDEMMKDMQKLRALREFFHTLTLTLTLTLRVGKNSRSAETEY